jgi:hypothetical protein
MDIDSYFNRWPAVVELAHGCQAVARVAGLPYDYIVSAGGAGAVIAFYVLGCGFSVVRLPLQTFMDWLPTGVT